MHLEFVRPKDCGWTHTISYTGLGTHIYTHMYTGLGTHTRTQASVHTYTRTQASVHTHTYTGGYYSLVRCSSFLDPADIDSHIAVL